VDNQREDLERAAERGLVTREQASALGEALSARSPAARARGGPGAALAGLAAAAVVVLAALVLQLLSGSLGLGAVAGLVALGMGLAVDGRTSRDHAFWLYLAGLVAFWGGLFVHHRDTPASLALGAIVNGALVTTALLLRRRLFAAFGAVGLAGLLGHLAADGLVEEVLPLAYAAIGLAVAAAALIYDRFEARWSAALLSRFPAGLRRFLPPAAARR
jgi:hypothetical protein